ncbi:tRNA (adenine37-N(6))-methyltransferase TrmN6 [Rhodovulum sp. PH10]|uniref:tRNA1(Val) (adenine(37)-N6)-methyltransferase n=1 Tax=Rhodovulum sp. PH10 TaxID=1187851 RepID=UPI00027C24DD|nr:methyltransferase [Rhodovulum sp. PH10]EJW12274.1 tRNA (adenine37-N(6))-methyltransferase TrmN6 [Rhodovulum sp. PH10]
MPAERSATDAGTGAIDARTGEWTEDAVLNGRLRLLQPRRGHRFGHDAILLAASTPGSDGERAVELGAGVGAAGLALARRVPGLLVILVEIDPALAEAAGRNATQNGLSDRVRAVAADVGDSRTLAAAGLLPGTIDRVLANPPFHAPGRHSHSPDPGRRSAHLGDDDLLAVWCATAARLLRPGGTFSLIYPADRLGAVLAVLSEKRFGSVAILPVHGKPDAPAVRVLVRATRSARGPLALLPALQLADADGRPTAETDAVLREGSALPLAGL